MSPFFISLNAKTSCRSRNERERFQNVCVVQYTKKEVLHFDPLRTATNLWLFVMVHTGVLAVSSNKLVSGRLCNVYVLLLPACTVATSSFIYISEDATANYEYLAVKSISEKNWTCSRQRPTAEKICVFIFSLMLWLSKLMLMFEFSRTWRLLPWKAKWFLYCSMLSSIKNPGSPFENADLPFNSSGYYFVIPFLKWAFSKSAI